MGGKGMRGKGSGKPSLWKLVNCRHYMRGFPEKRAELAVMCGECKTPPSIRSLAENPAQLKTPTRAVFVKCWVAGVKYCDYMRGPGCRFKHGPGEDARNGTVIVYGLDSTSTAGFTCKEVTAPQQPTSKGFKLGNHIRTVGRSLLKPGNSKLGFLNLK